jgi:uncharacterized membrane protein
LDFWSLLATGSEAALLVGLLALDVFVGVRLVRVLRDLWTGILRPRNAFGAIFGAITCIFLGGCLLLLVATVAFTFVLMKPEDASGIPAGIALFTLPFAWLLSEALFAVCYKPKEPSC